MVWIVEEKVEIDDLKCWKFFCACETEELADRIMEEFNLPMRKKETEIIRDVEHVKGLKMQRSY